MIVSFSKIKDNNNEDDTKAQELNQQQVSFRERLAQKKLKSNKATPVISDKKTKDTETTEENKKNNGKRNSDKGKLIIQVDKIKKMESKEAGAKTERQKGGNNNLNNNDELESSSPKREFEEEGIPVVELDLIEDTSFALMSARTDTTSKMGGIMKANQKYSFPDPRENNQETIISTLRENITSQKRGSNKYLVTTNPNESKVFYDKQRGSIKISQIKLLEIQKNIMASVCLI
jgi:hypothetical protein